MKLNYRKTGTGKPIIILHGLFGMSDNWQSFGRLLEQNSYEAYLVDLRNHGHSPHSNEHNYEVMANDILELIQDLNLHKPAILGHSMGGKVAMQFLNNYAEAVSKTIVVDIAPYAYPVHHREILDALLGINLEIIKTRSEAEKNLSTLIADVGTKQFLLKNLYWKGDGKLDWRFNLPVLNEEIENIGNSGWPKQPLEKEILFVYGTKSNYLDIKRFDEIRKYYPKAEFAAIENAGHWVQAEQPELLLKQLLRFLEN